MGSLCTLRVVGHGSHGCGHLSHKYHASSEYRRTSTTSTAPYSRSPSRQHQHQHQPDGEPSARSSQVSQSVPAKSGVREGKTVKGGVVCTDPAEWERETKLTWGCKEMQDASNGTSLSQSRAERDQPRDCHSLSQSSSVSTSRSLRPSWSGTCASISS